MDLNRILRGQYITALTEINKYIKEFTVSQSSNNNVTETRRLARISHYVSDMPELNDEAAMNLEPFLVYQLQK